MASILFEFSSNVCCPLGMCEALCFNNLEKFKIKSPRTLKHGILISFAFSSKNLARLSSTIVYKIMGSFCFFATSIIFKI